MKPADVNGHHWGAAALRWTARLLSLGLLALFAVMLVGEGIPAPAGGEELALTVAMTLMLLGLVVAFRMQTYGCLLITVGYVWFTAVDGDFNITNPFGLFALVALLYIAAWLIERPHEVHLAA